MKIQKMVKFKAIFKKKNFFIISVKEVLKFPESVFEIFIMPPWKKEGHIVIP